MGKVKDTIVGTFLGLSIVFYILFALALSAFVIAQLVIGIMYKDECPVDRLIPIWLIVNACTALLLSCCSKAARSRNDDGEGGNVLLSCCTCINALFSLSWLIAGSVFVYRIYNTVSYDPTSANYCNKTVYLFAFASVSLSWVLIGLFILALTVLIIYASSK